MSIVTYPVAKIEATANPGQLLTITDSSPRHEVGQVAYDPETRKWYIYAYNGLGTAATAYKAVALEQMYSVADPPVNWQTDDLADAANAYYVVCALAAVPSTYYGWWEWKGDVDALSNLTSEAHTAGNDMIVHDGAAAEAAATSPGCPATAFGQVNVTNGSAATSADVYLFGREIVAST